MRLDLVELQKGAEEAARQQPQAAHEVRAEDDLLALLRRRPNLPLRRGAGTHEVCAREPARSAEELDMLIIHLPSHTPERTAGVAAAEEELIAVGVVCSCSTVAKGRKGGKRRRRERGRWARVLCRPAPPAYL